MQKVIKSWFCVLRRKWLLWSILIVFSLYKALVFLFEEEIRNYFKPEVQENAGLVVKYLMLVLENSKWIPWGLIPVVISLLLVWTYLQASKEAKPEQINIELAKKCENLADEIKDFIFERMSGQPASFPENEKDSDDKSYELFKRTADYSSQTRALYTKKFNGRLHELVHLLKENGHKPDKLLTFGEDSWSDRKIGTLLYYAKTIRENNLILGDLKK